MEDILDHFKEEKKGIYEYDPNIVNEDNYLQLFWGEPRQSFGYLLNKDNRESVIVLFGMAAFIGMFSGGEMLNIFGEFKVENVFLIAAISGITNMLYTVILILLYFKVGELMGGEGDLMPVATAFLWANIPSYIISIIALIPTFFEFLGISTSSVLGGMGFLITGIWGVVNFFVTIWGIILAVVGLSVAHKFSNGYAISTYILASLIFSVPFMIWMFSNNTI